MIDESLTVIVPVYNEGISLVRFFNRLETFLSENIRTSEIIVVDDCSTDDSARYIAEFKDRTKLPVKVSRHRRNMGPCSGMKEGTRAATCSWVTIVPVDLPLPLDDYLRFFDHIDEGDITLGYTVSRADYSWWRRHQSEAYSRLVNRLFGTHFKQINYVALYKKEIFDRISLETTGVALHAEILVKALAQGFRVRQIEASYQARETGTAKGARARVVLKTFYEIALLRVNMMRKRRGQWPQST